MCSYHMCPERFKPITLLNILRIYPECGISTTISATMSVILSTAF